MTFVWEKAGVGKMGSSLHILDFFASLNMEKNIVAVAEIYWAFTTCQAVCLEPYMLHLIKTSE